MKKFTVTYKVDNNFKTFNVNIPSDLKDMSTDLKVKWLEENFSRSKFFNASESCKAERNLKKLKKTYKIDSKVIGHHKDIFMFRLDKDSYINPGLENIQFLSRSEHMGLHNKLESYFHLDNIQIKLPKCLDNLVSYLGFKKGRTEQVCKKYSECKLGNMAVKGRIWITRNNSSKRIYPVDFKHFKKLGYTLGRKLKEGK